MVTVSKLPRRSTRTRASTSSATRKSNQYAGVTDSPPDSPPVAVHRASRASRAVAIPESMDPSSSPFFMHSADHPGLIIISLRLDGTNYDDWNAAMNMALDAKNKIGFIDGSLPRPVETDSNFRLWSRCNSMVKSWLLNAVSPQIYRSVLRLHDAVDIWRDLYSRFHMTNLPRTFNLTQEIQDLRQGSMSLSDYYTTLKTLWDNLESIDELDDPCTCGKATRLQQKAERAKIIKFLAGLNDSYTIIRRQIIMKKVLPTLAEVYNILDQDDSQKVFSNVVSPPAAFQVSQEVDSMISYVQHGPNKGRPICSFCNRIGHIAERCYRKHGFPPGFISKNKNVDVKNADKFQKNKVVAAQVEMSGNIPGSSNLDGLVGNMSKEQIRNFIAMISSQLQSQSVNKNDEPSASQPPNTTGISFSPTTYNFVGILTVSQQTLHNQSWVIDSGATHHVCYDKRIFASLDDTVVNSVNLPIGSSIRISGVGTIHINKNIILTNVLFIPEFRLNLISISSLTTDLNTRVIFDLSSCEIQGLTKGLTIGQGRRIGNLYVLDTTTPNISVNAVADLGMWHKRLGRPSFSRLDVISEVLKTNT